jgi:hypothetical protein
MRLHLDTTPRKHPGAAPAGSGTPCGVGRTGLRLPLIAFMGDGNAISALARRAMR